jgi:hypothetical protein
MDMGDQPVAESRRAAPHGDEGRRQAKSRKVDGQLLSVEYAWVSMLRPAIPDRRRKRQRPLGAQSRQRATDQRSTECANLWIIARSDKISRPEQSVWPARFPYDLGDPERLRKDSGPPAAHLDSDRCGSESLTRRACRSRSPRMPRTVRRPPAVPRRAARDRRCFAREQIGRSRPGAAPRRDGRVTRAEMPQRRTRYCSRCAMIA